VKIFDCFPFFNELEILELRFLELYDIVDYFVIVEANRTHNGTPKEFIFENNKDRFKKWIDKVIYVKVEDMPDYDPKDVFKLEYYQRNQIWRGIKDMAKPGDKILVSDCDEIPNVDKLKENLSSTIRMTFKVDMYYYYVNNKCLGSWCGTVIDNFENVKPRIQSMRWFSIKNRYQKWVPWVIRDGGWHYAYMTGGDVDRIRQKIALFAEKNLVEVAGSREEVEYKINNSKDLYGRDTRGRHKQKMVDITKMNTPKHLNEWLNKYPNFINFY